MHDAVALIAMKRCELANRVRQFGEQSVLKVAVILVFGMGVWVGLFKLFERGFWFLRQQGGGPELSRYLMQNMLALFFFALTVMLVFSNGIILFGALFKARETAFLIPAPVRPVTLFVYRLGESLVFSSWAFFFLVTPLLVAYGQEQGLGRAFYFPALGLFALFIFIPAALGGLAAVTVTAFCPRSRRAVAILAVGAAFVLAAAVAVRYATLRQEVGGSTDISAQLLFQQFAILRHPLLPNFWIAEGIVKLGGADPGQAGLFFRLVASNALFALLLAVAAARLFLMRGWWASQGLRYAKRYRDHALWRWIVHPALAPLGHAMRQLVVKDLKTFFRDPVQWSQFLIFFGLLAIYFVNLRSFRYHEKMPYWKNLIAQLNLAATCLTLSTFTSRFVFPQLSLEGRRFWILGMMPITRRRILLGKFLFSTGGTLGVSLTLIAVSTIMLDTPREMIWLQMLTVTGVCAGLSGLSAGLGAVYPNFQEDNPSKIVSGFGGTLNLVLSLLFVIAVIALEATPCTLYMAGGLTREAFAVSAVYHGAAVAAVSAVTTAIPLWIGGRAIDAIET